MTRIKSENYFHAQPENYNCAQSILKGFQQQLNVSDSLIDEFKAFGGGRAEKGVCGALHAAEFLLKKEGVEASVQSQFVQQVGYTTCREIKNHNKVSCSRCVQIVDELLHQELSK